MLTPPPRGRIGVGARARVDLSFADSKVRRRSMLGRKSSLPQWTAETYLVRKRYAKGGRYLVEKEGDPRRRELVVASALQLQVVPDGTVRVPRKRAPVAEPSERALRRRPAVTMMEERMRGGENKRVAKKRAWD